MGGGWGKFNFPFFTPLSEKGVLVINNEKREYVA